MLGLPAASVEKKIKTERIFSQQKFNTLVTLL